MNMKSWSYAQFIEKKEITTIKRISYIPTKMVTIKRLLTSSIFKDLKETELQTTDMGITIERTTLENW